MILMFADTSSKASSLCSKSGFQTLYKNKTFVNVIIQSISNSLLPPLSYSQTFEALDQFPLTAIKNYN